MYFYEIFIKKIEFSLNDIHEESSFQNITLYDVMHLKINKYIWTLFEEYDHKICIIKEDAAILEVLVESIEQTLKEIDYEWDVYLPFDRFTNKVELEKYKISYGSYGYFIGVPIYLITKKALREICRAKLSFMPLDEMLITLANQDIIYLIFKETNWFSYDFCLSESFKFRKLKLMNDLNTITPWDNKSKETAIEIIKLLSKYCFDLGINLVIHAGSLIGHKRHNAHIMQWDDDIDFAIDYQQINRLIAQINEDDILQIIPCIFKKTNSTYYKCWYKGVGENTLGFEYLFPFVDIWLFYNNIEEGFVIHKEGHKYPKNICYPFKETFFEGVKVHEPNDSLQVLDIQYPGWRNFIKVFSWSHRSKKKEFPAYIIPITTNTQSGTLIELI